MKLVYALAALAPLGAAGCSTPAAKFTVLSTKVVDLDAINPKTDKLSDSEGSDGRMWFLFFPLGGTPTIDEAANTCLEKANSNYLVDGVVYDNFMTILLFTWEGYTVRGKAGVAPPLSASTYRPTASAAR